MSTKDLTGLSNIVSVKMSGMDELIKQMEDVLPKKVRQKVVKDAVTNGCDILLWAMKKECPEYMGNDPDEPAGMMADALSFVVRRPRGEDYAVGYVGPNKYSIYPRVLKQEWSKKNGKTVKVDYHRKVMTAARYVEFGTSRGNANPFMRRAFVSSKDAIVDVMQTIIKKALGLR
jgi:HK97 gp10 family phage protein